MQNFRNLFAGYLASSRNQSRPSRPPPAKRQKSAFYVPKETWTHEFFCLADCAAESAPSRSEKFELQLAGLGRKKIVFGSRDNAVQVKEKLEQAYPKVDKGGGFEILRNVISTSVCGLCVQKPPIWPRPSSCLHTSNAEKFTYFTVRGMYSYRLKCAVNYRLI